MLSAPTPITHELLRVVVSEAVGAADAALPDAEAPIAPDPPPVVSTPAKVIMVIAALGEICENVAVAVTLDRTDGANARQISAVPFCALAR